MARSKKKPTHPSQKGQRNRNRRPKPTPGPAPLLVIDQKPILKKALAQCRRLRTELHKKQDRLRHFEEEDMPAYQQWISATFGKQLTALREFREELADWEFIRQQMSYCEFWMPEKLKAVHDELMQRLKEGTLHAFEPPRPDEDEDEDGEEDEELDDMDKFFDKIFEEAFDEIFGDGKEDEAEDDSARQQTPKSNRRREADPERAARKALYRNLAKRLHPDHSDLEEKVRERRWTELQAAYESNDLAGLQRIEAVCDMEVGGLSLRLGLARLRDLAAYHRSHLRPIREALKEAKHHPAFGFDPTKTATMQREVKAEFHGLKSQMRDRLEFLRMDVRDALDALDGALKADFEDEIDEEPEDDHDFWADYTAWRDEELRRADADRKG